jgi:hypothetical protein
MIPTPTEAVALIANSAKEQTPGELAALLEPWLKDGPGWDRFSYEGWPSYGKLAAAHYLLRAAESLTGEADSECRLSLIALAKKLCAEVRDGWSLPKPVNDWTN